MSGSVNLNSTIGKFLFHRHSMPIKRWLTVSDYQESALPDIFCERDMLLPPSATHR